MPSEKRSVPTSRIEWRPTDVWPPADQDFLVDASCVVADVFRDPYADSPLRYLADVFFVWYLDDEPRGFASGFDEGARFRLEHFWMRPPYRNHATAIRFNRDFLALLAEHGFTQVYTPVLKRRERVLAALLKWSGYTAYREDDRFVWLYKNIGGS